MAETKDYMLVDEALDSSEEEECEPPKKQHRKPKEKELSHKQIPMQKSSLPLPRHFTLVNSPSFDTLTYTKEEGYSI